MPQMHFYVPDPMAKELRARARARGLTVSRYLASVVRRDLGQGWPEGFFEKVVGGWQGKPLRRPPQGDYEDREAL
ncbi:MAG: hypothetical protein NTW86_27550 [Candidatus Sumerlaeota bacterium]|nr:hypothetical protein [Candidatus Sumerlaeota bacterium]